MLKTFSDTAAICTLLDRVISVDMGVAHLSAALGKPTDVLLAYRPDWRWGADCKVSPWYPNVRLIRQSRCGGGEMLSVLGTWIAYKITSKGWLQVSRTSFMIIDDALNLTRKITGSGHARTRSLCCLLVRL